jgi:hypothetical protein
MKKNCGKRLTSTILSVVITGNVVTIKDVKLRDDINPNSCLGPRMYYVTVSAGAITNGYPGSLTYWEGFNDAFDWRIYTGADDVFMMPYQIVKPVAENLSIPAASTLEITFAENIEAIPGTQAKVKIYNAATDAVVDWFTVMPAHISGNKLTLVTDKLVDETEYYVLIEMSAFGDTSTCSTPFPGILDKTVWTFSTGDNTPPVPALAVVLTECEDTCVELAFTFNESVGVEAGAGMVNLWANGVIVASTMAVVDPSDPNRITAEFCNLADTTVYSISLDADAVHDLGNNMLPNAMIVFADVFETADNTVPVLSAIGPAAGDTESSVVLTVKANEKVNPVAGKKITISNGTTVVEYLVTTMVSSDWMTYTLPVSGLMDKTTYTVMVEAGAFADMSCDPNATVVATTWEFTTDDNTAPVVVTTKPVNNQELDTYIGMTISFTMSEDVVPGTGNITVTRGTDVLQLDVTGDKVVIDGNKVHLVLTDKLYFGVVNVSIPAGAFKDLATQPNGNPAYPWSFSIVDTTAPCLVSLYPADGAVGVLADVNLVLEFCERMAPGLATRKIKVYEVLEVQGQLGQNELFYEIAITADMIDGRFVIVPLAGLADNTSYTVMLDDDAVRDEAGNKFTGITDPTTWNFTTGDNTAPYVVSMEPESVVDGDNTLHVVVTFSEPVVGAKDSIIVANATSYLITTTNNIVFFISFTGEDETTVTITVPTSITDVPDAKGYGNPLAEEVTGAYSIGDNTAPTVTVVPDGVTDAPNNWDVVVTFSEAVVLNGGITVTGGTFTWTQAGNVYTLNITAEDLATVVLSLSDDITDLAGNPLAASTYTYVVGDNTAPTATVTPTGVVDAPNNWDVVITFSEEVVLNNGITVTGGTFTWTKAGNVYTLNISAEDLATVVLSLSDAIVDLAGNKLAPASYTYVVGENTPPVVSADPATRVDAPNTFDVIITFNETVTGVSTSSVLLTGSGSMSLSTIVAGQAYKVTLTGTDGAELVLSFTNAIKDLAGNSLVPTSFTYYIADVKAPTVVANPATGTNLPNENVVTLTFSEDVLNVEEKVVVTGAAEFEVEMLGDSVYQVTYTAADYAVVNITVPATVTDLKGNAIAPVTFTYTIGDHVAPTATVVPAMNNNAPNSWNVVITFSEAVIVPAGAISVTGATAVVTPAGNVYTVAITGADGADVTLSLSNTITDASENENAFAGATYNYTIGDNTKPVAVVSPASSNNAPNTWDVTITFSEPVIVPDGAISVTGAAAVITKVGLVYTVTITGEDKANVTLSLSSDITDTSVNANKLAAASYNYTIGDHVAPTATVVPSAVTNAPNTWDVVITFSEPVVVPAGAISVTGGTAVIKSEGLVYTVTITAVDGAEVELSLSSDITDTSLNENELEAAKYNYVVGDHTAPTATVTPTGVVGAPNNWDVVITFSEEVVLNNGITVTGGTFTWTKAGNVYTLNITAEDLATVVLSLSDAIVDLAGNKLAAASYTYVVGDNTAPTATVTPTGVVGAPNNWDVVITFSEEVVLNNGITVTGGTFTWTKADNVYTLNITAEDLATVVLSLSDAIVDLAGNKLAAASYTYVVGDNTAPVVVADPATRVNAPNEFDVLLTFSEPVTGVNTTTVLINGKRATLKLTTILNGFVYRAALTGADGDHLTLSLTDGIADLSGNKLVPVSFEYSIADVKAPTVVANPATGTNLPNANVVTLTFSEDVLNVEEKVVVTGATVFEVEMVGDSVYKVTYTAADYAVVNITVPATVTDLKGNAIVPVTFTYTIGDHVAPTATVAPAMNNNAPNSWNVVITFSEPVIVPAGAISVTGATAVVTSAGNVYTVAITGEDLAEVTLSLSNTITDASDNKNAFAGATYNYTIGDNTKPVAVVSPASNNNAPNTWDVTITFSEPVIVPEGAISVTGASAVITSSGLVYTVKITGVDGAAVALSLSSDITDTSANANKLAAATYNYVIGDNTAPTATVVPASAINAPGTWDVVITFSEPVNVPAGAISVTGATSHTVTNVGNVYTVSIKAADYAEVVLSLSSAITDQSANANPLAAATYTYKVGDNTAPVVTVNPATLTNAANTFTVTISFSEAVSGVNTSNVTVAGGTMVLNTLVAGLAYTATITAPDNANVVLTLSDAIKDLAGNSLGVKTFNYKVGCNSPEVRTATASTFVGEEVPFKDAAAGVDTSLGAGVHIFTYTMPNGCTGTLTVTVTATVRQSTIAAVQGTSWISPVVGATRGVRGTVTGYVPGQGYFIQDANAAWSGIWVSDPTTVVQEGNGIHVEGVIQEINGVTSIVGKGNVVNPPLAIVPMVVTSPSAAKEEQYESMNVTIKGVRAKAAKPDGTWDVFTTDDNMITIGKWMYTYVPVAGHFYNITGIVNGANDLFKLEPRKLADIVDLFTTDAGQIDAINFKVYPNPFNNELNIDNYDKLTRVTITNIAGQRVIDVQYPERVIRTANLVSGVYIISLFNEDGIVKSERIVKR